MFSDQFLVFKIIEGGVKFVLLKRNRNVINTKKATHQTNIKVKSNQKIKLL